MNELPIMIACRDAHRLISARMDRELTLIERIQLRLHLDFCRMCARVESQMGLLRSALRRISND
jgi:hypothetical protein